MKRYFVTKDRQVGSFGMNRVLTAYEWLEQAVEWWDHDNFWEDDSEREEFINEWTETIKNGEEQKLIDYIAGMWELDIEEYTDTLDSVISWISEHETLYQDFIKRFPELDETNICGTV